MMKPYILNAKLILTLTLTLTLSLTAVAFRNGSSSECWAYTFFDGHSPGFHTNCFRPNASTVQASTISNIKYS